MYKGIYNIETVPAAKATPGSTVKVSEIVVPNFYLADGVIVVAVAVVGVPVTVVYALSK
jgi:hypothetical protein